ncbi:hypothetical protein [Deinococcus sp.]|uniref:hypothetical protein n=1 Tax=Deinococcus sp. TaxID=47478 RepID=UPI0025F2ADB9|nr:hypothetical protein [Deinococcus sp.]
MMKQLMIALSLSAALSALPTALAANTGLEISTLSYQPIYTEASWQTLRVPLTQLGGVLPSDLTLSAAGLPTGITVTLTAAGLDGADAVLTVDVERATTSAGVNANTTLTLSSGGNALVNLNVPVIGVAVQTSGE